MFAFGIILLLIGCVLAVGQTISARNEVRQMTPQRMSHREVAIEGIRMRTRRGYVNSFVLIVIGASLVMMSGVFN